MKKKKNALSSNRDKTSDNILNRCEIIIILTKFVQNSVKVISKIVLKFQIYYRKFAVKLR